MQLRRLICGRHATPTLSGSPASSPRGLSVPRAHRLPPPQGCRPPRSCSAGPTRRSFRSGSAGGPTLQRSWSGTCPARGLRSRYPAHERWWRIAGVAASRSRWRESGQAGWWSWYSVVLQCLGGPCCSSWPIRTGEDRRPRAITGSGGPSSSSSRRSASWSCNGAIPDGSAPRACWVPCRPGFARCSSDGFTSRAGGWP